MVAKKNKNVLFYLQYMYKMCIPGGWDSYISHSSIQADGKFMPARVHEILDKKMTGGGTHMGF